MLPFGNSLHHLHLPPELGSEGIGHFLDPVVVPRSHIPTRQEVSHPSLFNTAVVSTENGRRVVGNVDEEANGRVLKKRRATGSSRHGRVTRRFRTHLGVDKATVE